MLISSIVPTEFLNIYYSFEVMHYDCFNRWFGNPKKKIYQKGGRTMEEVGIFALGFGLTFGVLAIAEHIADEF